LSRVEVEKRDQIIEQALKVRESTKQEDLSVASADHALEEATEIGRAEERTGMENALKAARESEQRRRSRALLGALFAFMSFVAAAIIGIWGFGLFTLPTEVWLALLGVGGLGFAVVTFYTMK